jgi:hypothetical protein
MRKKIASFLVGAPLFYHHFISHFLCLAQLVLTMPVQPDDPRLYIGASVEAKQFLLRPSRNALVAMGPTQKPKLYLDSSCPLAKTVLLLAEPVPLCSLSLIYFGDNVVKRGKLNIRSVNSVECSALHEELKVIL